MVLLLLLVLASVPVTTLLGGGTAKKTEYSEIQNVYLINDTEFPISDDLIESEKREDPFWDHTEFSEAVFSLDELRNQLSSQASTSDASLESSAPAYDALLGECDVCVSFSFEPSPETSSGAYKIDLYMQPDTSVPESDLDSLRVLLTDLFHTARLTSLNISEDQLAIVMADWDINTEKLADYLNPEDENKWSTQYNIQFAYAIIVMFVSIFSVSYIVRAIVEEKSSKLVELLMVSVKPLALIVGKILAALAYIAFMFAMLIAGYGISYFVSGLFLDVSAAGNIFTQIGLSTDLLKTGPALILIVIFSLLLSVLTFAIIAGLSATGCSTTEDMQSATAAASFLIIFGYIISMFAGSADISVLNYIASLFPIISVYSAPVNYVMGNIGLGILLLSWLIQIAVIVLLSLFCSRIYANLLMYRGSRVKLSQMISMARAPRAGKEEH